MISHKCATVFIQWSRLFKNICGEYVLIPMRTPAVLLYNLYPRIGCKRNTLLPTLIACMKNTCVCVYETRARAPLHWNFKISDFVFSFENDSKPMAMVS